MHLKCRFQTNNLRCYKRKYYKVDNSVFSQMQATERSGETSHLSSSSYGYWGGCSGSCHSLKPSIVGKSVGSIAFFANLYPREG